MKYPPNLISLIQTVLLAAILIMAVRISGQLPAQPAPTRKDYAAARIDYKARMALDSRVPVVDVQNWPSELLDISSRKVEVQNWPVSLEGGRLSVEVQNTVDVEVQNTVGVQVVR